jgi:hypothetical protein
MRFGALRRSYLDRSELDDGVDESRAMASIT